MHKPDGRIDAAVRQFATAHPEAFFIQIGANDGLALDPLRREIQRRSWRGIMVEPVPYVFERLYERYGGHARVALEQVAIADRDGTRPFYHLREAARGEDLWQWYHALGSFERSVVLRHRSLIPDIDERLVETEIPTLTFASLCRKHDVDKVDLLQIDTEGYDYQILRGLDLSRWRPRLIVYEHHHLSGEDRASARNLLERAGYLCFEDGLDTAGLDPRGIDAVDHKLRAFFENASDQSPPS